MIKSPNYVWHADGMDKLKPFGFAIHGCIDGYVDKQVITQFEIHIIIVQLFQALNCG